VNEFSNLNERTKLCIEASNHYGKQMVLAVKQRAETARTRPWEVSVSTDGDIVSTTVRQPPRNSGDTEGFRWSLDYDTNLCLRSQETGSFACYGLRDEFVEATEKAIEYFEDTQ
jgi:hypothetical protein